MAKNSSNMPIPQKRGLCGPKEGGYKEPEEVVLKPVTQSGYYVADNAYKEVSFVTVSGRG
jgi:hypothetical protein